MPTDDERTPDRGARPPDTPPGTSPDRPSLLDRLRDANEQLVVGSMRAQQFADEAEAARTEAETTSRRKDEFFLAVVSHELRTPLNAVVGWARLLGGGRLEPEGALRAMQAIERNAKSLVRIIDDLLEASRIIGGDVRIDLRPIDLMVVVQAALDEVRLSAEAKAISLTFTGRAAPVPILGDALRLQQVFANLLSNAIKFTPSGRKIEVRLVSTDGEAEVHVADTGQGIDPAFLPRIFDRFTQADTSTTRRQGGLGLGLALVRAFVERHGGTVQAESAGLGKGATFTVRLPVVLAHEADDTGIARATTTTTEAARRLRLDGVRVLLVEDDAEGREVLTVLLQVEGAKVASAGSVREALDVLDGMSPDVIVSDIGMPDEDGYVLIRRVRARALQRGGAIPVIALTGYVNPEDRARLLAVGFQAHLRKPVDVDEVVAAITSVTAPGHGRVE
jgi:signal transduction histidine kinase/ActR/RegA family two-component response regulator